MDGVHTAAVVVVDPRVALLQINKTIGKTATYFNVLFGVLQVLEQSVFTPDDSTFFIGCRVRVSIGLAGLTAKETVQIGPLLVRSTLFNRVALRAFGLEDLGTFLLTHGSFLWGGWRLSIQFRLTVNASVVDMFWLVQ